MSAERTWTAERIAQLKSCFEAGLTCAQIACEIGVSRNAVIGKINRLRLSRVATSVVAKRPRNPPPRARTQHRILAALRVVPPPEDVFVSSGPRCSLDQLDKETCRWPISEPGARDFGFCGGRAVPGLPYCAAHARLAYQPAAGHRAARR